MQDTLMRIHKQGRKLELLRGGETRLTCRIALGTVPHGPKAREGDGKTPEGRYFVCTRKAGSRFTLFMGISYPNAEDARIGLDTGLISQEEYRRITDALEHGLRPDWSTAMGGEIGIHGGGTDGDWTAGCIALADEDIRTLWGMTEMGTSVEILP
jgi:murein L,D-transpeptidase YafK